MAAQSRLIYGEIVAIGRVLNGERFCISLFSSYLRITHQQRPYYQIDLLAAGNYGVNRGKPNERFLPSRILGVCGFKAGSWANQNLVSELQQDYATDDVKTVFPS